MVCTCGADLLFDLLDISVDASDSLLQSADGLHQYLVGDAQLFTLAVEYVVPLFQLRILLLQLLGVITQPLYHSKGYRSAVWTTVRDGDVTVINVLSQLATISLMWSCQVCSESGTCLQVDTLT